MRDAGGARRAPDSGGEFTLPPHGFRTHKLKDSIFSSQGSVRIGWPLDRFRIWKLPDEGPRIASNEREASI